MKKYIIAIAAGLALVAVAQATDISLRQVRDPVQLKEWMEANISDVSGVATNIAGSSIVSGNIAVARITNALSTAVIPVAGISNAVVTTYLPASAIGRFNVVGTTQLVFIASGVTNVIDSDITH